MAITSNALKYCYHHFIIFFEVCLRKGTTFISIKRLQFIEHMAWCRGMSEQRIACHTAIKEVGNLKYVTNLACRRIAKQTVSMLGAIIIETKERHSIVNAHYDWMHVVSNISRRIFKKRIPVDRTEWQTDFFIQFSCRPTCGERQQHTLHPMLRGNVLQFVQPCLRHHRPFIVLETNEQIIVGKTMTFQNVCFRWQERCCILVESEHRVWCDWWTALTIGYIGEHLLCVLITHRRIAVRHDTFFHLLAKVLWNELVF